ncbi:colorectal mutant cancer protein-like [Carcharodon carcharias]|uniref:colorectal mutant cancer protein-like n=1 Tax=Carcharodon carcharias TaxID=13397 RepID=UPI001B7F021A|nr:colorectal mutant cancer protein-like [Carcharodon carcharias]
MECPDSLLTAEYTEVKLEVPEEEEALAVLHYEEQITELLVVIAELNRKIDRLTVTTIREEDEYLDTCSDFSDSHYLETSTCLSPGQDQLTDSDCPGQPCQISRITGEQGELSQKLHRVLTELEDSVRTRRTEIPHRCTDPTKEEEAALAHWELVTQTIEGVERELGVDLTAELQEERSQWEAELDCLREKNQHLAHQLLDKDQELWRVTAALDGIQRERDKLQLKADGLLACLQSLQQSVTASPPPSPFPSIVAAITAGSSTINTECEEFVHTDPGFVLERLIRSFQECSSVQNLSQLLHAHGSNVARVRIRDSEIDADQLRNCIDKWKGHNEQLSVVLQECKGDCERLSMLLGKHESNGTALRLALQYSEECVDVYELLLAEVETKGSSMQRQFEAGNRLLKDLVHWCMDKDGRFGSKGTEGVPGADAGTPTENAHGICSMTVDHHHQVPSEHMQHKTYNISGEPEVDDIVTRLRGDITRLRVSHAAVAQTILELGDTPPHLKHYLPTPWDGEARSRSSEVRTATQVVLGISARSTGMVHQQKKGKKGVLQELVTVRDDLSWLKGQLSWVKKERRNLEQKLRSQESRDEAAILLLVHWQAEREECLQEQPIADCIKEVIAPASKELEIRSDQLVSELTAASTREKQLRERIEELVISLEKMIRNNNTEKERSEELTSELRKTYSDMSTAYRNAKRKYENQLSKLQSQVSTMSERQAAQIQALEEKVMRLQEELNNANGTPL